MKCWQYMKRAIIIAIIGLLLLHSVAANALEYNAEVIEFLEESIVINDNGLIAGVRYNEGLVVDDGVVTVIPIDDGAISTTVTAINNAGQVVGYYMYADYSTSKSFMFDYPAKTLYLLEVTIPDHSNARTMDINDNDIVVGFAEYKSGSRSASSTKTVSCRSLIWVLYSRSTTTITSSRRLAACTTRRFTSTVSLSLRLTVR